MSSVSNVKISGLQSKVMRTYSLGVSFTGDCKTKRKKEIEANNRVRGLQVRQEDMIYDPEVISFAQKLAREHPNKDSKFAPATIQEHTKNYSNIGNSAYYQLFIAAKGSINREHKISEILKLFSSWNAQALEWLIFGRSPRVENYLVVRWKIKRIFILNLISSARRKVDKILPLELQFDNKLPYLTKEHIQSAIVSFCNSKLGSGSTAKQLSSKEKSFYRKLAIINANSSLVSTFLYRWNNENHNSRWKSLKATGQTIASNLNLKTTNLFSALRSIILFALSSELEGTVINIIQSLKPEECVSSPFKTKRKGRLPIYLLMKKDYVVIRPGNAKRMTELALNDGFFELGFPLKGYKRINGRLIFSKKMREYLQNGAKIRLLRIKHGNAPSYKIRVSAVLEGTNTMFISKKLALDIIQSIHTTPTKVLGLDINRLCDHILSFSTQTSIPGKLLLLIRKYHNLNSRIIPKLSCSLQTKGKYKSSYNYCKLKGELNRIYSKRKKLLSEIKNYLPHLIAAVIVKSKSSYLCIEDLEFDPRGRKGPLGKAFYSMPDEVDIFEKAVLIASKVSGKCIRLMKVHPKNTSSIHFSCGGKLDRSNNYYDKASCSKCGETIDAQHNAALNIKAKGLKLLQLANRPFPHARATDGNLSSLKTS